MDGMTPGPPPRISAVKILLGTGIFLCTAVPGLLLLIARAGAKAGEMEELFSTLLVQVAALSAGTGLAFAFIAGFVLLLRNVPETTVDSTGDLDAYSDRSFDPLDLRALWTPCLVFMACYDLARGFSQYYSAGSSLSGMLLFGGILNVFAAFLFAFFWVTGLFRMKKAGHLIPSHYFFWPALAGAFFFVPVLLGIPA